MVRDGACRRSFKPVQPLKVAGWFLWGFAVTLTPRVAPHRPQASGSALRRMLARLEHGVCVTCGLDCANLVRQLQVRLAWL